MTVGGVAYDILFAKDVTDGSWRSYAWLAGAEGGEWAIATASGDTEAEARENLTSQLGGEQ